MVNTFCHEKLDTLDVTIFQNLFQFFFISLQSKLNFQNCHHFVNRFLSIFYLSIMNASQSFICIRKFVHPYTEQEHSNTLYKTKIFYFMVKLSSVLQEKFHITITKYPVSPKKKTTQKKNQSSVNETLKINAQGRVSTAFYV